MNASFIDLLFPHGIHKTRSFQTIVQIEKKVNFFYTNISIICASCSKTRVTSNTIEIFLNKPCFFLSYCNFYDLKFYQHVFVSIKTYLLIKITKEHRYQLYKWWKLNQEKLRSDLNYMVYQSF